MCTFAFHQNLPRAARLCAALTAVVLTCLPLSAINEQYDVFIDHLAYVLNKSNHTATVVPYDYNLNEDYVKGIRRLPDTLDVPSTIVDMGVEYSVVAIGKKAFMYYESGALNSLSLPTTVTRIG